MHYDYELCIMHYLEVANRPKLSKYIKQQDIEYLEKLIKTYCIFVEINKKSELPIRDLKDLYLLSLCESIPRRIHP